MGVFEFIVILVIGLSLIEGGTKLMLPIAKRLADLIGETTREKRARRELAEGGERLPREVVAELETRLEMLEDRLDFLEALRAPAPRPRLRDGAAARAAPGADERVEARLDAGVEAGSAGGEPPR